MRGTVKTFSSENGYGLITGDDGKDISVHFTAINCTGYKVLKMGQRVEFDIQTGSNGNKAINVSVLERNPVIEHNTEDKAYWCKKGEVIEEAFVREVAPKINRNLIVHPNKKLKKTHIDLLDLNSNIVADLKTQNTPFFKATGYGFDPQYTVTFNKKDYQNYKDNYPEALIYWWVNWEQRSITIRNDTFSVNPLYGVWEVPFKEMRATIESGKAPLHEYIHRKGDLVNATESYLFNLNSFKRLL